MNMVYADGTGDGIEKKNFREKKSEEEKARVILDLVRLANEHGVPVRVFADPEHQLECLELEMFGRRMKEGLLNAHVLEQTRVI